MCHWTWQPISGGVLCQKQTQKCFGTGPIFFSLLQRHWCSYTFHLDLTLVNFSSLHKFFCLLSHSALATVMVSVYLFFSSIQFDFLHTVSVTIKSDWVLCRNLTRKQGQLVENRLTCRDLSADGRRGKGTGEESREVGGRKHEKNWHPTCKSFVTSTISSVTPKPSF